MQPHIKVMVFMTVILAVIPNGLCIKCWSCSSSNDPKCADPIDNTTLLITDCEREKGLSHLAIGSSMCRKIRQKVNGDWTYTRDCAYLDDEGIRGDEKTCFTKTGTDNIYTEYCTCNSKDGCNSSFTFTPKPVLLILAVVAAGLKIFL